MRRVIVSGANGFIGSSLINKLIKNDVKIIALDITFDDSRIMQSELVTKIVTELHDMEAIRKVIPCDEYDAFYHFAWRGVNGLDKSNPVIQLKNAEMAMNCASLAKEIGCKKFLCAGTIAEESVNSLSNLEKTSGGMMYGVSKHCTHLILETYCKNIGLDFIWMQFSNIYGPNNKTGNLVSYTIDQLINGNEATFGPALQPYDFIYVDDLIEAVYRLGYKATSRNCYFIGSGAPRVLKDYLKEIGEIVGKPELIKIGVRDDDGIVYTWDMFEIDKLVQDIGDYVSGSFSEKIKYTVDNY